ncbi:MBL fold metallo-hydrolase [Candidatus Reidiella endopervernicosa]|uniref:MBL fold metallo-hydrolase n=1 Tax=Candidatus Reidiella endopervernicosa TaxID=2738883 RepID=A0A6N0HU08_9GAMM|nr:MBL fold metallo-hydrolase [Candidatus Reidiella endopervernicosa]QKQ25800.1 MBL fold metallo-hydrolase [Candidatus Reidiella endopervernicosa]
MQLRQLFDPTSSTYSYLLWDETSLKAVIIDPVIEQSTRDIALIRELQLNLLYSLETHIHADHITGGSLLRETFGCKLGVHGNADTTCTDLLLEDGDSLAFGEHELRVVHTPGHTNTDISYLTDGIVFTGDTLLIRGSGRIDFQSGDPGSSYDSITNKLFTLPEQTIVYPAHDYRGFRSTTIGEEKKYNMRLGGGVNREAYIPGSRYFAKVCFGHQAQANSKT